MVSWGIPVAGQYQVSRSVLQIVNIIKSALLGAADSESSISAQACRLAMLEIANLFSAVPPVLWHRELQVSANTMCRFRPTYVTPSNLLLGDLDLTIFKICIHGNSCLEDAHGGEVIDQIWNWAKSSIHFATHLVAGSEPSWITKQDPSSSGLHALQNLVSLLCGSWHKKLMMC